VSVKVKAQILAQPTKQTKKHSKNFHRSFLSQRKQTNRHSDKLPSVFTIFNLSNEQNETKHQENESKTETRAAITGDFCLWFHATGLSALATEVFRESHSCSSSENATTTGYS
jgi:deoxyribodipyrimidine photolyase